MEGQREDLGWVLLIALSVCSPAFAASSSDSEMPQQFSKLPVLKLDNFIVMLRPPHSTGSHWCPPYLRHYGIGTFGQ